MIEEFKRELKELGIMLLMVFGMLIVSSPFLAILILVLKYSPEWVLNILAFGWIPVVMFWGTIKTVFNKIKSKLNVRPESEVKND